MLNLLLQAFIIALSGALMPGPLLTYNIQLSLKRGFWVGPQLIIGHAILELALILAVINGLGLLIQITLVKIILWLLGSALLLWMSYDLIWRESRKAASSGIVTNSDQVVDSKLTNLNPILGGMVVSLSNPYWLFWWATIGMGLLSKAIKYGYAGLLIFFSGHILADLLWYTFISGVVVTGKGFISPRFYSRLLLICGLFLFFIAVNFLYDALRVMDLF